MADSADVLKGNASRFSDVPAGQWYTGYVNLATSLQFVSGYPDGTFKPNSNITMQEALTVLMRIAGYNDNLVGPWPLNYIAQGGKLDVTDDVAFAGAAPATRAAIAVMASNILDINVVYWDADKTKFVEDTQMVEVIRTKGVDYEEVEVPITVLEDKFGACLLDETYIVGWCFDDLDDQELTLEYVDDYFGIASMGDGDFTTMTPGYDSTDLAESYWVSDGLNLGNFFYYQANLILNDDDEVVYVDITSRAEYSDDVTVDGDSVEVGGASKKVAEYYLYIPSDGDYTAHIFYNDDNEIYLVDDCYFREYANEEGTPYIFKSYNEAKDRIETYYDGDNIDTDVDLAILKDGQFITPADLKDKEVLHVYTDVEELGVDTVIFVTSFNEGELTKGTSSKLTVSGTALDYTYGADYSTDGLETFATIDSPDDVDDAYGTTVQYVTTLFNPYDLCLMVYEGGATNTLYGIVTDIKANIDGQVSAITVLGADGEEVEYTITKGDNTSRPEYRSYSELTEEEYEGDPFNLTFGTYIQAKVSEDGTIDTDDIAVLVDPIMAVINNASDLDYYGTYAEDYMYDAATMDINNKRIQLHGVYYTLNDDTLVFQTTTTEDGFDEAEVVDVADLMAADEISEGVAIAFIDSGVVKQLFMLDTDLNSKTGFGILDNYEYRGGDWYGTLLGGGEYTMDNNVEDWADIVDKHFFSYHISGDKLIPIGPIVYTNDDNDYVTWTSDPLPNGETIRAYDGSNVQTNGNILTLLGVNYTVNDDTIYYKVEDGTISEGDIYDIEDGVTDLIVITTDTPEDDILAYVFVLKGTMYTD